ncbi:nuclear transport factor 2 family protein [Rheinheimera aquimaris]|uniref:nuclear transport factor 2 family protein n=1 Tax=Rheinheimera aquimaris TaxID=412437 RepID=UPI001E3CE1DC|nr:nuclear transport factor 2 family protein [Rheinheimera aquimaris]MCD1598184.1 nuclear transport factor 2 family protein [Rheinheimera aquimaris]
MTTSGYVLKTLVLIGMLIHCGVALADSDTSSTQRNKQFIAQAFQQWADGGGTFFQDVLSTDVIWTIKGTGPAAGIYRGRDVFIEQAVAPFAARLSTFVKPTVNSIWADGKDVIVYWDGAGVAKDGKPYNNSFVWIFKMEQMRAIEVIAFLNLSQYEDVINRVQLTATPGT